MEHRWSPRKPLHVDVVIHYPPLGLVRGTSRDISLDGMFVDTGRILIPTGEVVEICFRPDTDGNPGHLHMDAEVIHASHAGIGLLFRDYGPDALLALKTLLLGDPEGRVAELCRIKSLRSPAQA